MRAGTASVRVFRLARAIWVMVALISLVILLASPVLRYQQLAEIKPDARLTTGQLRPIEAQALENIRLSVRFYAAYITVLEVVASVSFMLIGVLIFWRRSDDWVPLLFSLTLVSYSMTSSPLTTSLELIHPIWEFLLVSVRTLALTSMVLAFLLFPDGRFVPAWAKWLAIIWVAYLLLSLMIPALRFTASVIWENKLQGITFTWALLWLVIIAAIQAYRYRYRSTFTQRLQTKWVVFGLTIGLTLSVAASILALISGYYSTSISTILIARLASITIIQLCVVFMSAMFAVAILRSHLWDIDVIIRKTLVYGALSLTLALIYFGSVILLQSLVTALGGPRSAVVTVVSTLLIAALFTPLRRRIQNDIDRRFYRKKYDAEKTIAAFSASLRQEVDLEQIGERLLIVVEETIQPESLGLWLKPTKNKK